MYIKKLELLNFQVIEKFDAEFNGAVYFITGDNELGKSTLLKAIGALLTGNRDAVLRNGAEKGFAKMVVGDDGEEFNVELKFTEANPRGTLTIKQKSTGMQTNNVSMLQRVFGYQDFDAVEFSRWSETAEGRRKQIAVVKSLLAPEVRERIEAIDAEVSAFKDERAGLSRDIKTFAGFVETIEKQLEPGDVEKYSTPVDVTELMEKQRTAAQLIEKAKTVRATLAQRTEQIAGIPAQEKAARDAYEKAIAEAEADFEEAKKRHDRAIKAATEEWDRTLLDLHEFRADMQGRKANCEAWLAKYEANNPENENIPAMIAEAEFHNKRFNLVGQYKEKKHQYDGYKRKYATIEGKIADLSDERAELIAGAALPVEGLTFTDDGLELNGIQFVPGKVSDSQAMEIAAKLVIASNPTVKVFRIARGESLGGKRLEAIVNIAKKNGFQGFIENVVRGQEEMRVEEYTEAGQN